MVDDLFELSEEIAEQIQTTIVTEIDLYLNEIAEPLLEVYWELKKSEKEQPFSSRRTHLRRTSGM